MNIGEIMINHMQQKRIIVYGDEREKRNMRRVESLAL